MYGILPCHDKHMYFFFFTIHYVGALRVTPHTERLDAVLLAVISLLDLFINEHRRVAGHFTNKMIQ